MGTMKSFLSKKGSYKVKIFVTLRAHKRGTIKSFLNKTRYNKVTNFLRAARAKKGYNKKLAKQNEIQ